MTRPEMNKEYLCEVCLSSNDKYGYYSFCSNVKYCDNCDYIICGRMMKKMEEPKLIYNYQKASTSHRRYVVCYVCDDCIDDLLKKSDNDMMIDIRYIKKLQNEILELKYKPDGIGAKEAQEHFDLLGKELGK